MNPNSISLDISDESLAALKDKAVGETCELTISATVTKNDGKNLEAKVDEVELGEGYSEDGDSEESDSESCDSGEGMDKMSGGKMGEHKPIAIIAISGGMKKS